MFGSLASYIESLVVQLLDVSLLVTPVCCLITHLGACLWYKVPLSILGPCKPWELTKLTD